MARSLKVTEIEGRSHKALIAEVKGGTDLAFRAYCESDEPAVPPVHWYMRASILCRPEVVDLLMNTFGETIHKHAEREEHKGFSYLEYFQTLIPSGVKGQFEERAADFRTRVNALVL